MLINQTLEQLRSLGLFAFADEIEAQRLDPNVQTWSFEDRLARPVLRECEHRDNRRQQRSLKAARLKVAASPEDIDYRAVRGLDRSVMASLLSLDWAQNALNIVFTGKTGVGKTWLACALAQQAIRKRFSVVYWRLARLLEQLEIARGDGTLIKLRAQLGKAKVLILDDWGLAPMTDHGRRELLEIVEDRHGSASTIITSQLPIDKWHDYIGEPTYADSILDRFLHRAHRIELHGESMRKQHALSLTTQEE